MKAIRKFSVFILALFFMVPGLRAHPGRIIQSFPLPANFCTGLTFDGQDLWVADYKTDIIYKIDPVSGEVLHQIPSPGFWPTGLAWDGKNLWNVDREQDKIFRIDPEDGTILWTIDTPCADPDGMTWDGTTLWLGDAGDNTIIKIDLCDGTAVKTLNGPAQSVNGLAFDGRYLWSSDRNLDEIYMIDPATGEVIMIFDAPGPYSRGLAWDGSDLWNVDYQTDSLYRIVRMDEEHFRLTDTRSARITLTHEVKVYGQGNLKSLDVFIAMPEDMPHQKIFNQLFTPENYKRINDRWQQPVASFSYQDVPPNTVVQSIMMVDAEISAIRYFIDPDQVGPLESIPGNISRLYTTNGSKYQTDDPYIQNQVREVVGNETNPYWMARKIFNYVRNTLEYEMAGGWNAAPVVLQRRTGSCSEYTFSFISMCRAAGLPARYAGALVVRGDDASLDESWHRWPEVYLPNYGWIPMDPQGGDKPSPRDQAMSIGNLSNRFLITTRGGGDSEYLAWYYNMNEMYQSEPQVKVHIEKFGEWEP
ncbi:MAG: glutaminyl-peptide cyclotransferase, partial [Bacteroidales bacterium]|nr:glutaminyl-peptide cyclotransferase [Bacteroidales bacterium]